MALNVSQLQNQIKAVFAQQLKIPEIASQIASAYQSYAVSAQAPPGGPMILKGTESKLLELALTTLMQGVLLAPAAAQNIGNAVVAFWMLPPVLNSSGGLVTAVIPAPGVAKMMATNVTSPTDAAQSLAQALDLITKTVLVVNPPPLPSGPLF